MQRAQELEIIHKTHESKRERKLDKLRYSYDEYEDPDLVRAGYSSNNQIEEKFAALQTSLTNAASRFYRFENSICQQISKQTDQKTKNLEQSSSKQVEMMTRQNEILMQGMKDTSSAIVGVLGSSQRPVGGQPQSWKAPRFQAPFTPNLRPPLTRTGSSGQLNFSNPPPEEAECFNSKAIGHYAKQFPSLPQSNSLDYRQPSMQ